MYYFPELKTARFSTNMQELKIKDTLKLLSIPAHNIEVLTTQFLESVLVDCPLSPKQMTIEERNLCVCHYISATSDDKMPDFVVGDNANLSNYLNAGKMYPYTKIQPTVIGNFNEQPLAIISISGANAEAIERLNGEVENLNNRSHFLIASMAAQLIFNYNENDFANDTKINDLLNLDDEQLLKKVDFILNLTETEFLQVLELFTNGTKQIYHYFNISYADEFYNEKNGDYIPAGYIILPINNDNEKGGGDNLVLSPARFQDYSYFSKVSREIF